MYFYVQMGVIGVMAMHVWGGGGGGGGGSSSPCQSYVANGQVEKSFRWVIAVTTSLLRPRRAPPCTGPHDGSFKFILNVRFWFIPVMFWPVASVPISELGAIQMVRLWPSPWQPFFWNLSDFCKRTGFAKYLFIFQRTSDNWNSISSYELTIYDFRRSYKLK